MKQLLILITALSMLVALAAPAGADKPDKPGKPEPDVEFRTCAELGWDDPSDGTLVFGATDGCEDVPSSPGATFTFTLPDVSLKAYLVLGVRNSVPGDWCDGWWTVGAADPVFANALLLRNITPGLVVTLIVDDDPDRYENGNCMSDDEVLWNDETSDWVVTAMGRIPGYKGSIDIGLDIAP
jgi:hypothetical protein